ncbi:MAG TPA: hypothetical protein VNM40_03295 [Candidatus Paceibacterota bacterium]|nr:hypothetical protein [Candidatus Paceibacterota bacterium]
MADEKRRKVEGTDSEPVPSGAMYIGLCQTRAQAAVLRWQYAFVFMALNGVVGGWCLQLLKPPEVLWIFGVSAISIVMIFANYLFRGLVVRSNQWIDYFTIAIEHIEEKSGTETGVRVFSDPNYLSRPSTQPQVQGFRFRQGIRSLYDIMVGLWITVAIVSVIYGAYLYGKAAPRTTWLGVGNLV